MFLGNPQKIAREGSWKRQWDGGVCTRSSSTENTHWGKNKRTCNELAGEQGDWAQMFMFRDRGNNKPSIYRKGEIHENHATIEGLFFVELRLGGNRKRLKGQAATGHEKLSCQGALSRLGKLKDVQVCSRGGRGGVAWSNVQSGTGKKRMKKWSDFVAAS